MLGSLTTVLNFGFSSLTTVLNCGFSSRTTALKFWLCSRTAEFNSGFGSQTTVLNFGLDSRTIAVTSWRNESSNISLVVLDNTLYYSQNLSFEKLEKRGQTDGQDLPIKSPRRRLKK